MTKGVKHSWANASQNTLLVGGKAFDVAQATEDEILAKIKALPGGFSDRTRIHTRLSYDINGQGGVHEQKAYEAEKAYFSNGHVKDLGLSIEEYYAAAKAYEDAGDLMPAANMYSLAGQRYLTYPKNAYVNGHFYSERAIACFDRAIELHQRQGHSDFMYRDQDKLYEALAETVLLYRKQQPDSGAVVPLDEALRKENYYYQRMGEVSEAVVATARRIQGILDKSAARVEQKEFGISDTQPIGTDNVSQCVALMVGCKPDGADNYTVALAHIDYETDVSGIRQMIGAMPEGKKQVRIVGARFDQDAKSKNNLARVVAELALHNVDIISSSVHQGDYGASAVVVDPKDFSIKEACAMGDSRLARAACAHPLLTSDGMHPMRKAFDFTHSDERLPILLDAHVVGKIQSNYLGQGWAKRYKEMKKAGLTDLALSGHFIQGMLDEYREAFNAIHTYAQERYAKSFVDKMPSFPLYIGPNALTYNQQLLDCIVGMSKQEWSQSGLELPAQR